MKSLLRNHNKKKLPVPAICRNCSNQLVGRFCHHCGQDLFAGSERTVGEIIYHAADTIFAWDNKIFNTLKYLLFYPGKLTKEFFSGRVIQYVYPAKLFWFISILFFATINLGGLIDGYDGDEEIEEIGQTIPYQDYVEPQPETQESESVVSSDINTKTNRQQELAAETRIKQSLVNYVPYVVFLLIPFFALLLFLLFYKKKSYYASHIIFALHFHSFVFLIFTLYALVIDYIPESLEDAIAAIMFFLPAIYLIIALYVAYRPSIPKLIWKIPFIMFTYAITCSTILVLFIVIVARIAEHMYGTNIL